MRISWAEKKSNEEVMEMVGYERYVVPKVEEDNLAGGENFHVVRNNIC